MTLSTQATVYNMYMRTHSKITFAEFCAIYSSEKLNSTITSDNTACKHLKPNRKQTTWPS